MIESRHIDKIITAVIAAAVFGLILFMNGGSLGLQKVTDAPAYEKKIFDDSYVHEINIDIDAGDWREILENAEAEEYYPCTVTIDGESFSGVGIRAKGNNSLEQTAKYSSERFSLKVEFDHYSGNINYHGLDKLSLNSGFQDNSYLKEYIAYDMMRSQGVATPLCSYAYITINGEDWGLYTAVEEVEEAFARRNYGSNHGVLYKPDYKNINDANTDVALIYTGEDEENYSNIFDNARFDIDASDKKRLIAALKTLSEGRELEKAVDVDSVIRYFTVQSFVVNLDSYLGRTGHNYCLYEEDGVLSMIPWDYNLAYATYMQGIDEPENDPVKFVNYPIDTPAPGEYMLSRPMFHNLMMIDENFFAYHDHYSDFIADYFESGYFESKVAEVADMISPYVKKDPTKFCSFGDHLLAVDTFSEFCILRAKSVRGQLNGEIPSTIKGQAEDSSAFVDASHIRIEDMGDFEDMRRIRDAEKPE